MINYLMQQIQSSESTANNSLRRANELSEKDRETAQKRVVDLSIKYDDASVRLSDLANKVNLMQQEIQRADQNKTELRDKLRTAEEQNLQMANFIKGLQSQSETELAQMRNYLQTIFSENHADQVKSKEKSSILFNELVRIGQESEKQQRQLQGLNTALEERIAVLEGRLQMQESNNQMVNRKGDAASMFLNEVFERVEGKLMGLEQNVSLMGME